MGCNYASMQSEDLLNKIITVNLWGMRAKNKIPLCIFGLLIAASAQVGIAQQVAATWLSGDSTVTSRSISSAQNNMCREVNEVKIMSLSYPNGTSTSGCLYEGRSVDLLKTNGQLGSYYYVKFHNERYFHGLNAPSYSYLVPGTDLLVTKGIRGIELTQMTVYRSLVSALEPSSTNSSGVVTHYSLKASVANRILPEAHTQDYNHAIYTEAFSANGRYMIAYVDYGGYVKIDLQTMTAKIIAYVPSAWYYTLPKAAAITSDGRYAVIEGGAQIVDTANCGDDFGNGFMWASAQNPCDKHYLSNDIQPVAGYFSRGENFVFSDQDKSLEFDMQESGIHGPTRVHIDQHGYVRPPQLEYLALGDSYSSGEGDTEINAATNQKYYREHTDTNENKGDGIPREKCHVSTRSYPYILSRGMGLGDPAGNATTRWQTVACSGALIRDSLWDDPDYLGQDGRLDGFADSEQMKATALNEFIPGRQKQIEFVKKYKPKVITLTMGGNDVGFADKVSLCLRPIASISQTCRVASAEGRYKLERQILDQYENLKSLYENLYEASGLQAKIYVLSYPQFINESIAGKCSNTAMLDLDERRMIVNATELINNVIEQAARSAGVKYIDIEDSLSGGRLCDENQEYMTAITNILGLNGNELQESFHPNAKGHFQMAMTVWEQVGGEPLADYDICPGVEENICPDPSATEETISIPSYFGVPSDSAPHYSRMTDEIVSKAVPLTITTNPLVFNPSSTVNATMYSDPTDLGDYGVNDDGSFGKSVQIPSTIPAGYHTLVLSGKTYSGEPVVLEQIILVKGADSNDIDEDGVADSQQACGPFLIASGQDEDMDGIDDACDPEISETSQLYRIRTGDVSRQYAGASEIENYLYVERNVNASAITGIVGDYDADGDDWAVVGVSKGKTYTSKSAPDTAPYANFIVEGEGANSKPFVYIRAGGFGCTSFTPVNLKKVKEGQVRYLKKAAYNTDKCRQEAPSFDADGNGEPDDAQTLYTARNGDPNKGEDVSRIYLYRNFYAAEAQLGISDYTPTGTPAGLADQPIQEWNLLASSKPDKYIPAYNSLVILPPNTLNNPSDSPLPIILTKKQNGQCIAYKPSKIGIIKQTNQDKRYLTKMAVLPEGITCE